MCSTCDYTKYVEFEQEINGRTIKRLKNDRDELDIHCDMNGNNYKIGKFSILRCPICGRELFENYRSVRK